MHCTIIGSVTAGVLALSCSRSEVQTPSHMQLGPVGRNASNAPSAPKESARGKAEDLPVQRDPSLVSDEEASLRERRDHLIAELRAEGIRSDRVLEAIRRVPRHLMVPSELRSYAYGNHPLPIGYEQTISQPYIVALMSELADIQPGDKALEIGTGSGYQAAVLAELGATVYSIEVIEPLGREARRVLTELGYGERVRTRIGDGYRGWPEDAPFDAIVITAAPPTIPEPLKQQLAVGGKLVVPVGESTQQLVVLTRTREGFERTRSVLVRFVPMTGEAQGH